MCVGGGGGGKGGNGKSPPKIPDHPQAELGLSVMRLTQAGLEPTKD